MLTSLGMVPAQPQLPLPPPPLHLAVFVDGRVAGAIRAGLAPAMVAHLRAIKAARLAEEENPTPGETGWQAGRQAACMHRMCMCICVDVHMGSALSCTEARRCRRLDVGVWM